MLCFFVGKFFNVKNSLDSRGLGLSEKEYLMIVVPWGPPGVGKGTLCENLAKYYGFECLVMGDVFRRKTPLLPEVDGLIDQAEGYQREGKLVPDNLTCEVFNRWWSRMGEHDRIALDGFPRTVSQAEHLTSILRRFFGRDRCLFVVELCVNAEHLSERVATRGRDDADKQVDRMSDFEVFTRPAIKVLETTTSISICVTKAVNANREPGKVFRSVAHKLCLPGLDRLDQEIAA